MDFAQITGLRVFANFFPERLDEWKTRGGGSSF